MQASAGGEMKLISCTSNEPLAQAISDYIKVPLTKANIRRFADQEVFVEVLENVRGRDVFVVQSTCTPANEHIMELLIMIDALRRASARRITAVIPYFGYARQDRKATPRTPISAKLVANLLTGAGTDRVLTVDLHAAQLQGFFDIPVDNLFAGRPIIIPYIQQKYADKSLLLVSPDVGGVVRARALAKTMDAGLAIIDKRREKAGISEVMHIIGDVKGRDCILMDDMIDSAGTMCNAADALMEHGALSVSAAATHGVFSGSALDRIENSCLSEVVVTDTIRPADTILNSSKVKYLSVASLLGEAMIRIRDEKSVSSLFEVPATGA